MGNRRVPGRSRIGNYVDVDIDVDIDGDIGIDI